MRDVWSCTHIPHCISMSDKVAGVLFLCSWLRRGFFDWCTLVLFMYLARHFRYRKSLFLFLIASSLIPLQVPDCVALFLGVLQLYLCRNFRYWKDLEVPSLIPQPLVGNMLPLLSMRDGPATFFQQLYDSAPNRPYVGFYIFDRPALMVRDPDILRDVLVKSFPKFMDRLTNSRSETDPLGAANLFCLRGTRWRRVRAHVSPTFTSGRLKDMIGDVVQTAAKTRDFILVQTSQGALIDVKDALTRTALDIICRCLFGLEIGSVCNSRSHFRLSAIKMMKWSIPRAIEVLGNFFEPRLVQAFPLMLFQRDATSFLRGAILDTLAVPQPRSTYSGLVARSLVENSDVTEEELLAQGLVFFGAGFETTATTAMLALYELARNLQVQTVLRDEIAKVLREHEGQVTYDALQKMTYLHMVISETLRLYPPMAFIDRLCAEDTFLPGEDGKILQAGTPVFVSILGIHRDPLHFPEPLKFDPTRFNKENKRNIKTFTYIPFGDGPRNCIGSRFALLSVKVMLVLLLQDFEVHMHPTTPRTLSLTPYSLLLRVLGPLPLSFVVKPAM